MDKVKPYLALLKKHHFWLLSLLVVLLSAFAWRTGTSAYDEQLQSNRSKIRSSISSVEQIRNTPNPPNASFAEGLKGITQEQTQSTLSAWQTLYDRQKDILRWSIQHDQIAALSPEDEIPKPIRDEYMNYFAQLPNYWPKLFDIIDPLRTEEPKPGAPTARGNAAAQPQGGSGTGGRALGNLSINTNRPQSSARGADRSAPAPNQPKQLGIVEWAQSDRDAIRSRYEWRSTPTSTQVRVAQEDYWIYKTLFEIIANTNQSAGATRNSNAAIKKIETLAIAQAAAAAPYKPSLQAVPNEALPTVDSASLPKVPAANATDEDLLNGRYATSTSGAAGGAGGEEFKLIPILMRFRMDERRIPNLLVACANSPLPVKVQQVLYNPSSSTRASSASTSGRGTSGSSRAPSAAIPAASSGSARSSSERYDATVELRGVVYMFNPPSKTALGLPDDTLAEATEPADFSPQAVNAPQQPADEPMGEQPAEVADEPLPAATDEAPAGDELPADVPTEIPAEEVPADSELPPDPAAEEPPPQA